MSLSNKQFLLILLSFSLLIIASCTGGTTVADCSQSNCDFYQGSQGIETRLLNDPGTLFYHSDRVNDPQGGNEISLNLELTNRGVSDSFGAVFVTGFGPPFKIFREGGSLVQVSGTADGCNLQFFGDFSNFRFACGGFGDVTSENGAFGLNLNFDSIFSELGWDESLPFAPDNMELFINDGGEVSLDVEFLFDRLELFYHGKILVLITSSMNFESLGGMEFTLRGFNPESRIESQDYKTFHVEMDGYWPAGSDTFRPDYEIRTCYGYTTFASPQICVDPQPNNGEEKLCQGNVKRNLGTQGSPVAVTQLDQVNTGRTVELVFTIENVGRGEVWDVASLERCSPYFPDNSPKAPYKDLIYVGFAELEGKPLQCDRNQIRLNQGSGQLRCTYDLTGSGNAVSTGYVAPLRLELWYGYEESIKRTLNIRRAS